MYRYIWLLFIAQLCPATAYANDPKPADEPADPVTLMMDFELNERQIVEAAAKTRTTIQQAPAIITVITAKEIRDRGYRTLNDVLSTIPGFEGDRWEFYGWYQDNMTRGNPRTALVLLDGVNIVGPIRNTLDLERKLPLSMIKRIEVTSGPGSVLWGSNALLGVVNIITHDGRTKPGIEVRTGGGDGPGEQGAAKAQIHYGGTFFDDAVRLYFNASYFTTNGPELKLDAQKLYGPLPAPSGDSVSLYVPEPGTAKPYGRDHSMTVAGNLGVGKITLGWFSGITLKFQEIGPGGTLMAEDYRKDPNDNVTADELVTQSNDQLHSVYLRYSERFGGQDIGVSAQSYLVHWQLNQNPLGIFPRSNFSFLEYGATTSLRTEGVYRGGLNLDLDFVLPADNHLLIGGELFIDSTDDVLLTSFDPIKGPETDETGCRFPFEYQPGRDPLRPCSLEEIALKSSQRTIAALYAQNEWLVNKRLAVNVGARGQFSSTYDPTVLFSGGMVLELLSGIFLKATYGEGFRPPDFQSTAATSGIASGISFEANPNLDVERSRATEIEVNARLFENMRPIRRWYLRTNYSYSQVSGIIGFPAGKYENSGDRDIHSIEALSKLVFYNGHELWLSYYFVDVVDSEVGRLRNIANHIVNTGGRLSLFNGHLHLASVVTFRGEMEDLNRDPNAVWDGPPFTINPSTGIQQVAPTGIEVTRIPSAILLRIGIEGRDLFDVWSIGGWVYNVLNTEYADPDFFFDDRIISRPQPKPGLSFFLETSVKW